MLELAVSLRHRGSVRKINCKTREFGEELDMQLSSGGKLIQGETTVTVKGVWLSLRGKMLSPCLRWFPG